MNNINIRKIIFLVIAIFLAILAVNFILWLLPIILIIIAAYFIYDYLNKRKISKEKVIKDEKRKMK